MTLFAVAGCGRNPLAVRPPVSPAVPAVVKPPAKPMWQARKVLADAVAVPGGRRHTVKRGETGIAIARAYGVDWAAVVAANKLKPPYVLEVGDGLLLPSKQVAAAMTVEQRAAAFRIDIDDLITGSAPAASAAAFIPSAKPPLSLELAAVPRFVWPVEGRIVSGFGAKPSGRFNDGVNIRAAAGAAVRAAADGTVAYAGDAVAGFGNLLLIRHPGGWVTAYAHNEALLVGQGAKVGRGEPVARAGRTGNVEEVQLHFEVRRGRTPLDPVKLLPPKG